MIKGKFPLMYKDFKKLFRLLHINFLKLMQLIILRISRRSLNNVWFRKLQGIINQFLKRGERASKNDLAVALS